MLRRREVQMFPDQTGHVSAPEDVLLGKLIYYREGGSDKHLRDIAGIVKVSGETFDWEYLTQNTQELGLADLWNSVLRARGRPSLRSVAVLPPIRYTDCPPLDTPANLPTAPAMNRPAQLCLFLVCVTLCFCGQVSRAADAEAFVGQPLGVARVTVGVLRGEPTLPLSDERFTVQEQNGRAFYPVVKDEPVRQFVRGMLGIETPRTVTVYFLFRGNESFDLSVYAPTEQGMRITPLDNAAGHQRLLNEWWEQMSGRWQRLGKDPQFPAYAENFLVATFARRLERSLPKVGGGILGLQQTDTALQELLGGEAANLAIDRDLVFRDRDPEQATIPLPEAPQWLISESPVAPEPEVVLEPLAEHVPEECFYLRFGSFTNYLWFRDLQTKWDGDFKNMLLRRALQPQAAQRIEQQLSLKETALSRILGPQFISDAALVGLDPYLQQGGAVGLLVEARNSFLLSQDFMRQRREALTKFPEAKESTITLEGQEVSLVATPDGRVRSYYAQSGNYHLVTTSRRLAERFLQASAGRGSLAKLASFRAARAKLPADRGDRFLVFVSERFFQNLCSPSYWIESRRRLQAAREPMIIELARHAAECEGLPAESAEELVAVGILPRGFGSRPDGSRVETRGGVSRDSLRGTPGFFTPVGDVEVTDVSEAEQAAYGKFLASFADEVGQMPPITVAVRELPHESGANRSLAVEVLATPLGSVKLGSLVDSLGEPIDEQLQPIPGDLIAGEVSLDMPIPLIGGERQPHLLFGALRDYRSPLAVRQGTLKPEGPQSELVRGYVGTWPRPGLLKFLQDPAQPPGAQPQPLGEQMWQAENKQFLLISFKPEVIHEVQPQLGFEPAARPAQVRLRVADLTGTQFSQTVNALGYMRARETAVAPSRLMNSLANLLQIPRAECREFAERLADGTFVSPLGGEYQLIEVEGGLPVWSSTALPASNRFQLTDVPEDFQLALLKWFRGLESDLRISDGELSAQLEVRLTEDALPE